MRALVPSAPLTDLARLEDLSQPSTFATTGVHHGYRQRTIVNRGVWYAPEFADMLAEFDPIREAWLSWLDPGGFIVAHIDAGPYFERWQVPLSAEGALIQDDVTVAHEIGVPFRVHQYRWHSVRNAGDRPRVSIVIDRDIPLDVPSGRLRIAHASKEIA